MSIRSRGTSLNSKKTFTSWDILASVVSRMRELWQPLVLVHIAYLVLGIILLSPLAGLIVRLPLWVSGQAVLKDQDILYFFLTPTGMACLILVTGIVIAITIAEQASMLAIAAAAHHGRTISVTDSIFFAARRFGPVLMLSVAITGRLMALAAPFLAAGALFAWFTITRYDINYYLSVRPPAFWAVVVASCFLIAAMAALILRKLISWSLAFPLVVLANSSPWRSFGDSSQAVAGARWRIFQIFAIWSLVAIALTAAIFVVFKFLGQWILPNFMGSLGVLAAVLGFLLLLWFLANAVSTAFTSMSFALTLAELAGRYRIAMSSDPSVLSARGGIPAQFKITPVMFGSILAAGFVASLITGWLLVHNTSISDNVLVIAHRGASGKAPDNTLASVRQAITDGADWIEIDVQETADGEVVVFHDSDFMKVSRLDLKIWDATVTNLEEIDVGSWFDPSFSSERVPTLKAVLDEARGKAHVLIELKYYGHDQMLEERVVQIVESAHMVPEIAVMSLKPEAVQKLLSLRPKWTAGVLIAKGIGKLTKYDGDFLAVHGNLATSTFIRRAHAVGKRVLVWTVNDAVTMSRLISFGADGLITDYPGLARRVLEDRANMSPVERLLMHVTELFDLPTPPIAIQ